MTVRALFLHTELVESLILTLKFDRFLDPQPTQTYIFYGPRDFDFELFPLLQSYGIDTSTFILVKDREMWQCNSPPVNIYQFGGWISQQFIKFLSLDYINSAGPVLIQDCDTFNIKPYTWIDNNDICLYYTNDQSHTSEYYSYLKTFTGRSRDHEHSFVSEFMPVRSQDWQAFKQYIEHNYCTNWIEYIYNTFVEDSQKVEQIWFSEYELLGNWALQQNPQTKLIEQHRFLLKGNFKERLDTIPNYNVICNYMAVNFNEINEFEQKINSYIGS